MKKCISMMLCLCMLITGLTLAHAEDDKLRIVTTIFPPYDFARAIGSDHVELTMLLSPGAESHSFEPSPRDIITIQNADIFLYAGGEGDAWVDRILESMDTSNLTILPMIDMVSAVEEEIVEGMEHVHDDHDEHAEEPHDEHATTEVLDRSLTEWDGSWASLAPYAADGRLDAYLTTLADDADVALDAQRKTQTTRWQSDYDTLQIDGDTITLDTPDGAVSSAYTYDGFAIVEGENGDSVWYQFQATEPAENLPTYVIFNDHGTGPAAGNEHDDHDEHEEHDHEHGVAHTHIRYGNDSYDALLTVENWSPFYVEASATDEEILATLTGHSHSSHSHGELDEHVWTSPQNAKVIATTIAGAMSDLDPTNAATYAANVSTLSAELDELDAAFVEVSANASRHAVLFGDRFPFRYLVDAYGLDYYAAFSGCATETEASAATIAFLIDKTIEESIPVVFSIEFSNGKIADTIAESTGAARLEMHSCHNLSKQDFDNGETYVSLMWRNVDALKEALN